MADDDIERLLREVETATSGAGASGSAGKQVAPSGDRSPARAEGEAAGGRFAQALRAGLIGGAITGVLVFVIFMLTPFVGAWGPGVGGFVGGFLNGFYFSFRSRG